MASDFIDDGSANSDGRIVFKRNFLCRIKLLHCINQTNNADVIQIIIFIFSIFDGDAVGNTFYQGQVFQYFLFSINLVHETALPLSLINPLHQISMFPIDSIAISFGISFNESTATSGKLNAISFLKAKRIFGDVKMT